jgi:hypothetical protein
MARRVPPGDKQNGITGSISRLRAHRPQQVPSTPAGRHRQYITPKDGRDRESNLMVYRPDLDNSPPSPASNPSRMKKPVHKTAITMNQNGTRLFIVTSIPDRR